MVVVRGVGYAHPDDPPSAAGGFAGAFGLVWTGVSAGVVVCA